MKLVQQHHVTECGLACLSMVVSAHRGTVSLRYLRTKYPISIEHGLTLFDLIAIGRDLGMAGRALAFEPHELSELRLPCILHWGQNHFVVLSKVWRNKLEIYDPALGRQVLEREEAREFITGYAVEFEPDPDRLIRNAKVELLSIGRFTAQLMTRNSSAAVMLVSAVMLQILALAMPSYVKLVVDEAIKNSSFEMLMSLTIIFGFVFLFHTVYRFIVDNVCNYIYIALNSRLSSITTAHLFTLPKSFFQARFAADIKARVDSADQISDYIVHRAIASVTALIGAVFALAAMVYFDLVLAAITVSGLLFFALIRIVLGLQLQRHAKQELVMRANADEQLLQMVQGVESLKIFGLAGVLGTVWGRNINESFKARRSKEKLRLTFDALSRAILHVEQLAVITYASYRVLHGEASIGAVFAYIQYKQIFGESVLLITETLFDAHVARVHVDRISDILLSSPEAARSEDSADDLPARIEEIGLTNVSIAFPGQTENLLQDISFTARRGKTLVLMGEVGSGKSTLLGVLTGLFTPETGQVTVDGRPLTEAQHQALRARIASISPRDSFFPGTIAQNISSFSGRPDMERIIWAAKMAKIHDRIEAMDFGYNMEFKIARFVLSTGQMQCLLIARALYAQRDILLIDEFSANLDAAAGQEIWQNLRGLDCVRIVATHAKFVAEDADQLLMIRDRRLVELEHAVGVAS